MYRSILELYLYGRIASIGEADIMSTTVTTHSPENMFASNTLVTGGTFVIQQNGGIGAPHRGDYYMNAKTHE